MNRLKGRYEQKVKDQLAEEFSIKNIMAIPSVVKVVINSGIGEIAKNKEALGAFRKDLAAICGQEPSIRLAKISVASFNIRRGMPVGVSVTLRGLRMYSFLDKLISIVLPRLRDFRGVAAKSFDKYGNFTIGFVDHTVFPEVDVTKSAGPHGLEVTFIVKNGNPERSKRLLELLGMPFTKEDLVKDKPFEKEEK